MEKNEEFNNFMHRVNEITNLVHGLASTDQEVSARSAALADTYLKNEKTTIRDENVELRIKSDRTIINEKACHRVEKPENADTMDPETFMAGVGRDAEQRAQDRKVRREKADTLKMQALKAFRRGEYERALTCYNKAIDYMKDSALLYTNRALTLIKLNKFDKVVSDCDWALRLNENSFKARLYRAKAHRSLENIAEYERCYKELMDAFPQHRSSIEDFLKEDCGSSNEDISKKRISLT